MKQPEKRFPAGACIASVCTEEMDGKQGKVKMKTVVLQRLYRDRKGNVQFASSLRADDIPKAKLVLEKAYEYLVADEQAA